MCRKFSEQSPITVQVQKTLSHIVLRQLGYVRHSCNHWRIRRKRQMKPAAHDGELPIDRGIGRLFTTLPSSAWEQASCTRVAARTSRSLPALKCCGFWKIASRYLCAARNSGSSGVRSTVRHSWLASKVAVSKEGSRARRRRSSAGG